MTLAITNADATQTQQAMEKKAEKKEVIVVSDNSEFANLLDSSKFGQMWRVALLFSESEMVPQHYRGKPSDCFIAVETAVRLGVAPFMFMQKTHVIHGKPGMEAQLAIALINSSGLFASGLDYEVDGENPKSESYRVRAFAIRRDTAERINGPWIDWPMVVGEGWKAKSGSKWVTMPAIMFRYRAASLFGRLHCPERLMGMQTADELHDAGETPQPNRHANGSNGSKVAERLKGLIPSPKTAAEIPLVHEAPAADTDSQLPVEEQLASESHSEPEPPAPPVEESQVPQIDVCDDAAFYEALEQHVAGKVEPDVFSAGYKVLMVATPGAKATRRSEKQPARERILKAVYADKVDWKTGKIIEG